MAAAFSFKCPQCGKSYENVKSNMAGCKVSCTCGKVFRLGPKTEAQIAARVKRKAEKAAKKASAGGHPPTLPTVSVPVKTALKRPTPNGPFETDIPGLEDELDVPQPVTPATQVPVNPGAFEDDSLLDNPVAGNNPQPAKNESADSGGALPLGWALATPEPTKKSLDKKSKTIFERKRGPIASLLNWFAKLFSRRA